MFYFILHILFFSFYSSISIEMPTHIHMNEVKQTKCVVSVNFIDPYFLSNKLRDIFLFIQTKKCFTSIQQASIRIALNHFNV